jgi:type IV secretory pathway TraG/TraD family ATPase VirD4
MTKDSTSQSSNTIVFEPKTIVQDIVFSPIGLILALVLALVVFAQLKKRKPTNILARGKMATDDHRENARLKVIKLIKAKKHNEVGTYLGTPNGTKLHRANGLASIEVGEDRDRVYLEATGGTYFLGLNGSGKSFSGGLPQVRSWLDQGCGSTKGFPVVFYDIKFSTHSEGEPCPSAQIAGYAKVRGYRVHVLAPGVPIEQIPTWANVSTINLLDFVRSHEDIEMARQLVVVLLKNLVAGFEKMNPYFRDGCISALQGLVLLAKLTDKPDLLTCRQLLKHPNLLQIIRHEKIPESVRMVFDTFIDAMAVPETFAGIKTTCTNALGNILMPGIAPSICGKTTVPLDIDGNDLIILGVDGERRDIVAPIIASIIHLHVNRNLLRPRQTPYGLSLDEVGSIFLPDLDEWPNQYRSAGLILQVLTQSPEMLIKRYGKDGAARIAKGCANHILFQLDYEDAKVYAQMMGQTDVVYESTGSSSGKNNKSTSTSEQRTKIDLLEAHELVTAPQGKALVITRSSGDKESSRVPFFQKIVIPQWDLDAVSASVALWNKGLTRTPMDTRFKDADFTVRNESIDSCYGPFIEVETEEESNTPLVSEDESLVQSVNQYLTMKEAQNVGSV